MPSYVDYSQLQIPDFGKTLREGVARGRSRSYADSGDFERAGYELMDVDPQAAQNYLTYGDRREKREFGRSFADAYNRNDFAGAGDAAARAGNVEGVQAAHTAGREHSQEERLHAWRTTRDFRSRAEGLNAISDPAQKEAEWGQLVADFRGSVANADPRVRAAMMQYAGSLPETFHPNAAGDFLTRMQSAERAALGSALTPEQAAEMDAKQAEANAFQVVPGMTHMIRPNAQAGTVELGAELPLRPQSGGAQFRMLSPEEVEARGLSPGNYQENIQDNRVAAVPPARSPYTEGQSKAGTFADRMTSADQVMQEIERAHADDQRFWLDLYSVGALGGGSADVQRYRQAMREFQNSILRRESGAVIAQSEFDSARQQYAVTPTDRPETIAQKQAARQRSLQGLVNESQGFYDEYYGDRSGQAPAAPTATQAPQRPQSGRTHYDANGNPVR